MSDRGELIYYGRESLSASRSGSVQTSAQSTTSSQTRSLSKENSGQSGSESQSRSQSNSRSQMSSPEFCMRSRSLSQSGSDSCSYSASASGSRSGSQSGSCSCSHSGSHSDSGSCSRSATRSCSGTRSCSCSRSDTGSCSCTCSCSRTRSRSETRSRSHFRSRSPRDRNRRQSRSRSYSRDYREYRRRRRSHSPLATRRRHVGNRSNPDPNCCLGVFGLSLYTTERDLRDIFSKYGPISHVSIVYDQQSRRSRGFAFVYFENVEDAKKAKESVDGIELDGRRIRVDFSITKRPHTPTPGIYMGRPTYNRRRDYHERGYERGYNERDYYNRSYRGIGGGIAMGSGGGWRNIQDRDLIYRRRTPSPYYSRGRYQSRSRSRPYSPRHF